MPKNFDPTIDVIFDQNNARLLNSQLRGLIEKKVSDAPVDDNSYIRKNGKWVIFTTPSVSGSVTEGWVENRLQDYVTEQTLTTKLSQTASQVKDDLIGSAPETYNTLEKIAKYLTEHDDVSNALYTLVTSKADRASTLEGYGITDAYISDGKISLGSRSITPVDMGKIWFGTEEELKHQQLESGWWYCTYEEDDSATTISAPVKSMPFLSQEEFEKELNKYD